MDITDPNRLLVLFTPLGWRFLNIFAAFGGPVERFETLIVGTGPCCLVVDSFTSISGIFVRKLRLFFYCNGGYYPNTMLRLWFICGDEVFSCSRLLCRLYRGLLSWRKPLVWNMPELLPLP